MYKFSTRRSTITIGSKGINTKNKHLEIKDKYYSRKSVCVHGQPVRERATKHERNMNYQGLDCPFELNQTMTVVDGIKYIHLEFVMLYHLNHEVTLENLIAYPDMRINQLNKEAKDNILLCFFSELVHNLHKLLNLLMIRICIGEPQIQKINPI